MALRQLRNPMAAVDWLRTLVPTELRSDHRALRAGEAFLAWPGGRRDARDFVTAALQQGAVACLVEAEGAEVYADDWQARPEWAARIAILPDLKRQAGVIASALWGQPSAALEVVAITGTNGKTSCSWWVAQALQALGQRCGVIGTLGVGEMPASSGEVLTLASTGLTTPDPLLLQGSLRRFQRQGLSACAMEASSIGLADHRLTGTRIQVAGFTNFTQDHLDWHGDMSAYWAAKRQLFDWPGLEAAVVNVDDPQGADLLRELAAAPTGPDQLWAVGLAKGTATDLGEALGVHRLVARDVHYAEGGLAFTLQEGDTQGQVQTVALRTSLIGDFNVHNLLVVAGCLRALGLRLSQLPTALTPLQSVPGRLQIVPAECGPAVVVDYAHTPDALEKALAALRPWAQSRGGRLLCVFGCGGNRDATKRPLMGRVAQQGADGVILTSDNPRHEDPQAIAQEVLAGLDPNGAVQAQVQLDRAQAIELVLSQAQAREVVLLAGKGHETTQDVAGQCLPFNDVSQAAQCLRALRQRWATEEASS